MENFVVGYLDKLKGGVTERPFNKFAWEGADSEAKQRVQYFKYRDVVVWDKGAKLDKIFGSTGGVADIMDIINAHSVSQSLREANIG